MRDEDDFEEDMPSWWEVAMLFAVWPFVALWDRIEQWRGPR